MSNFCKPERNIRVPWAEMREQSRYEENTLMRWAFRRNWERHLTALSSFVERIVFREA